MRAAGVLRSRAPRRPPRRLSTFAGGGCAIIGGSVISLYTGDNMEAYKQEFIKFMVEADVLKFGEFTLKSGRKSPSS